MTFQLDQAAGLPAPAANHPRQRAQQQVVDLCAIGRGGDLQQLAGQLGVEGQAQGAGMTVLQAGIRPIPR